MLAGSIEERGENGVIAGESTVRGMDDDYYHVHSNI